ncbi:type II toxin-antitoxin system Phd/YefM family antitoxin [Streptomyces sp. NBC_00658]|uniref:type II toxin-antitoxin system Phd/YefM family antitoxin n=1 Tax=Streptomyces sp. NBC_00658 TaxID=2975800 RepID=UPI003246DF22
MSADRQTTAREFNQNSSKILAAAERGDVITVTKNGRPVARVVPISESEVPPYPTDPMGEIELPELDLLDLTNEEIDDALKGMGS